MSQHEKNLKCCEICEKFDDFRNFEGSLCLDCFRGWEDLENSGECAIEFSEYVEAQKIELEKIK